MKLTSTAINKTKSRDKDYKLFDGNGLYLLVKKSGSKLWRLKYRYLGKEKTLSIGQFPLISLKAAREAANDAKIKLSNGIDPSAERQQIKRARMAEQENSFEAIAREWAEINDLWSDAHRKRVIRSLEKDVFPHVGNLAVTDIQTPDMLSVIRSVESRDALDLASRILQRSSAVFRYAIQTGRCQINPMSELAGVIKRRKVQHMASVPREELPALVKAIEGYDGYPVTKYALKILMLSFVRPGELRGARWDEFDMEAAEWRIPGERMKMGTEHIVPLSTQTLENLRLLKPLTGQSELVFHGERSRFKPISENTMTFALYRLGYKGRATPHGFRATASSILNEQGFSPDAIERQLSHIERNNVRAAYTHHARFLGERRKMMQWWSDFISNL